MQDLLAKINSMFIRSNSGASNNGTTNQTSTSENGSNRTLTRQNSSNRSLTRQNSANRSLTRQNSANRSLTRQNSTNPGLSEQNSSNIPALTENTTNENLLEELEKVDGVQVLDRQDDNLDVQIRGSPFRITVSKLIDLAPEINRSVKSTMKFVQSRTKKEKISKLRQLINFFELAKTALANQNAQGIMVQIDLGRHALNSIEPIVLNFDQL